MINKKHLIIGLSFLLFSTTVIAFSNINLLFVPSQEDQLKKELEYGALTKDFIIVQEITMKKEYLRGVELLLASSGTEHLNQNTLMLLDSRKEIIYTAQFTNENLQAAKYRLFKLPEKVRIGKGEKIIICLFSATGDKNNYLSVPRNPEGKLGSLTAMPIGHEDALKALEKPESVFFLAGSLIARTYESNYGCINWFKAFLFLLFLLMAALIAFAKKIKTIVGGLSIAPEKIYLPLALIFGLALVFLTPPLQAPDEHDHFNRAYQVSELNLFQHNSSVPSSLVCLFDAFEGMNFHFYKKTSINEILSQKKVELNPHIRTEIFARDFTLTYIPQALGISIGKTLNRSPVELLYLGRLFNLFLSVFLIYSAIRIMPVSKWTMFLLGLMPMTIFLCASLSKDAMLIGVSFLLFALFLRCAYGAQDNVSVKDLLLIFGLSFLLTTGRPVYGIIIGLFILIPVSKIGSLKKYIIVFFALVITVLLAAQSGNIVNIIKQKQQSAKASGFASADAETKAPQENFWREGRDAVPENINPAEQKKFIMADPVRYAEIFFSTVKNYWRFYLDSFIGVLGWLNKPLPGWLINFYLLVLVITAILFSEKNVKISLMNKLFTSSILIVGFVLIKTGIYLGWTPVGNSLVEGVQGRYFIPFAPLFFLLFYNSYFAKILSKKDPAPAKKKKRAQIKSGDAIRVDGHNISYNFLYLSVISFALISLFVALYVVLTGYYIVLA